MRRFLYGLILVLMLSPASLLSASPSQGDEYFRRGFEASMAREWDAAIQWYTESIRIDSTNPEAFFQRAVTMEMTGRLDQAIEDYEQTLSLKPDYYLAMEYLAKLYEKRGRYAEALDQYNRALPLVKKAKWRSIVKQWIREVKKKIKASEKSERLRSKAGRKKTLY